MKKNIFSPFPNLTTDRFNLRELQSKDENEIFVLRSDERIIKYLGRPPIKSTDEAVQFIAKINTGISNNEWIYWVITRIDETEFIGTICLWNFSEDNTTAEIGFELLPDYWGKGVMQEVIPTVLSYGFERLILDEIVGEVDSKNIKSIKLMEKYGFTYKKDLENTVIYSLRNPNRKIS